MNCIPFPSPTATIKALESINLSVPTGSRTVIVGPSGSGKTTLLRMIAGFEFPDSGRLSLNGQTLVDDTHEVPAHQRLIGYVPQDGALFPHMTVAANIGFGLSIKGGEKQERIAELMDSVALDANMANRWPHELSGGQQQRVALARALAQQPRLMLLDEPFSALDTGLRGAMRKMVARLLSDAGVTTILVTHDQSEALSFADQLAVMRDGRLVQSGHPLDLYRYPDDEQTALFLGDAVVMPARIEAGWAHCDLGRIPVNNHRNNHSAQIMLRPEQLQLVSIQPSPTEVAGCRAVVTERDFSGNTCTLTVELEASASGRTARPIINGAQFGPVCATCRQCGSRLDHRPCPRAERILNPALKIEAIHGPTPLVVIAHIVVGRRLDIAVMGEFLGDRQIVLLNHSGNERTSKIMRHDFHPDLRAPLSGDVIDRMFGDALAGDVAATTDAVEQERIVHLALLQLRATQLQPVIQFGERPGRCVLDQLFVALGGHPQAALGEIDLIQVQVHRFRFAHARAVQNPDDRRVPQPLWPWIGGTDRHQFLDQRAPRLRPWDNRVPAIPLTERIFSKCS